MNHRYRTGTGSGEPITVVAGADGAPAGFRWRGRQYAVVAVVATWVEALPWWVGHSAGHSGSGHSGSGHSGSGQRWIWRVEAVRVEGNRVEGNRRTGATGVYDLYQVAGTRECDPERPWGLERVID